jgi:hypothetical protein
MPICGYFPIKLIYIFSKQSAITSFSPEKTIIITIRILFFYEIKKTLMQQKRSVIFCSHYTTIFNSIYLDDYFFKTLSFEFRSSYSL